nr:MAG TPA: hypothetical protein [Caudoviricetes sp.]
MAVFSCLQSSYKVSGNPQSPKWAVFFCLLIGVYPLSIGVIPLFASHLPPIWAVFFFRSY